MRKRAIRLVLAVCALTLLSVPSLAEGPWNWGAAELSDAREWTIMAFINGDNNLEQAALDDLKEMEAGLPAGGAVEVVVLLDRSDRYSTAFGDEKGAHVYRITRSDNKDGIASTVLADLGPIDMSDAKTLTSFVTAATAKFPAKKTALVMWDHGGGWGGMSSDEGAKGADGKIPQMSLAAFEKALAEVAPMQPGGAFELAHFDMCLMGQAEVAAACAPYARWMLASTPVEPALGMDYAKFLPLFVAQKPTDELLTDAVHSGCQSFLDGGRTDASLSAYDLSRAERLTRKWRSFADALLPLAAENWAELTRSFYWSQNYGPEDDESRGADAIASVDLNDWLSRLGKLPLGQKLAREIDDLRRAGEGLTIASESGPSLPRCTGLSFYAPLREKNFRADYAETAFDKATGWSDTLRLIYAAQGEHGMEAPRVTGIEIGSPVAKAGVAHPKSGADYTITPAASVTPLSGGDRRGSYVKIAIEGRHILRAYVSFAMAESAGGPYTIYTHQILHNEHLDEAQEKSVFPTYTDGTNELLYQFGGVRHLLCDDEGRTAPVTVNYLRLSSTEYALRGVYADPVVGERSVVLTVDARYNALKNLTAVDAGGVAAIAPRPEGAFTPVLDVIENGQIVHRRGPVSLKWGTGLSVAYEMYPKGSFAAVLARAESLGGAGGTLMSRRLPVAENAQLGPHQANARARLDDLKGMFFTLGAVPRASGKGMMIAPTGSHWGFAPRKDGTMGVIVITPRETKSYRFEVTSVGLPMMTLYHRDKRGLPQIDMRFFAVRVDNGGKAFWRLMDSTTGAPILLIPQNDVMCPPGWLNGLWTGDNGSYLAASDNKFMLKPRVGAAITGTYENTGDAVRVTDTAGGKHFYNGFVDEGKLALTDMLAGTVEIFTSGEKRPDAPRPTAAPPAVPKPPRPRPSAVPPTVIQKAQTAKIEGTWVLANAPAADRITFSAGRYTRVTLGRVETGNYVLSAPPRNGKAVYVSGVITGGQFRGMSYRNTLRMIGQNRMIITFGADGQSSMFVRTK